MSKKYNITAIIYDKRDRVLSIGQNDYLKTHPFQKAHAEKVGEPYKQFLHAEISAIIRCSNLKKAHRISIFRFNNDGTSALAKPCAVCLSAIKEAGITIIEHT
jgi:deoxycytidylate deaminase